MSLSSLRALIRNEEREEEEGGGDGADSIDGFNTDSGVCERSLVSTLVTVACCVRGVWAPRSEHVYAEQASRVGSSRVPHDLMCAARDHLVSVQNLFYNSPPEY